MIEKVKKYFTFKNFLQLLVVINIILITFISTKAFLIIDTYMDEYDSISIYQDNTNKVEIKKNIAASTLVSCINSRVDIKNLPDNIKDIIKEINNYYKSDNRYYAFKYQDIYTGFTVSYNENGSIWGASTVKAPLSTYIYELASEGKTDLNKELEYKSRHYVDGTGKIKNMEKGTQFTIRDLVGYSIKNSDNIAYIMLLEEYGRENVLSFWENLGTETIFTTNTNWGNITAYDAGIYMNELYNYYLKDTDDSNELMNYYLNATFKPLNGGKYRIANKSGWANEVIHDVGIVFADNPYVIVALSKLGDSDDYQSYFNIVSNFASRLHQEYWKYKMEMCTSIVQY